MAGSRSPVWFVFVLGLVACTAGPLASEARADPVFLVIDEDSIDNGIPPNFFSEQEVNDDLARIGLRSQLRFFAANVGRTITLHTGEVGDEGWFAVESVPEGWVEAGPTEEGLRNFFGDPGLPFPHNVGPGLGSGDEPESLLDDLPGLTPLRATGLKMLEGRQLCAVVFDSDVNVNYAPLRGSLKGETLGTVAFEVVEVTRLVGFSQASLPEVEIRILDVQVCAQPSMLELLSAPPPVSSSEPFDIDPMMVSVNEDGVVNGASFAENGEVAHAPAPGSIVSIFGTGFASQEWQAQSIPLPSSLGGVEVKFNGVLAPLLFVGPGQINAQVPWVLLPDNQDSGRAMVVVTREGVSSPPREAPVERLSPAIFTFGFGSGPAVAINPDGTVAQPLGTIPGVASHPAVSGSWIAILATGLGPLDDPVEDGMNSLDRLRVTNAIPKVLIDGQEAAVLFSGLSPQYVGVYQVNAQVLNNTASGDFLPLQIEVGSITTPDDVTIAVE